MYGMPIQDKLRASNVKRWHIVTTSRPQSMAEHSFNVAHIGVELCEALGFPEWRERVAVLALYHDLEEIYKGDIPTPAKGEKKWDSALTPHSVMKMADLIETYVFALEFAVGRHGDKAREYMFALYMDMLSVYATWVQEAVMGVVDQITQGEYRI